MKRNRAASGTNMLSSHREEANDQKFVRAPFGVRRNAGCARRRKPAAHSYREARIDQAGFVLVGPKVAQMSVPAVSSQENQIPKFARHSRHHSFGWVATIYCR